MNGPPLQQRAYSQLRVGSKCVNYVEEKSFVCIYIAWCLRISGALGLSQVQIFLCQHYLSCVFTTRVSVYNPASDSSCTLIWFLYLHTLTKSRHRCASYCFFVFKIPPYRLHKYKFERGKQDCFTATNLFCHFPRSRWGTMFWATYLVGKSVLSVLFKEDEMGWDLVVWG
jgi:hypothetical protein